MHKLVLIDDHKLFRIAVSTILKGVESIDLIKEYSDHDEAYTNITTDNPDAYLIDLNLGDKYGFDFIRRVKRDYPKIKLIVLSMHIEEFYLIQAIENDVDGYIHKDVSSDELVSGILKVLAGKKFYSTEVSNVLINNIFSKASETSSVPSLTNREKEIIKYIADGLSSKEISNLLSLSPRTIEAHRARILDKLGLRNTAELVKLALEQKII